MIVYGVMIDGAVLEHDDTRYFYPIFFWFYFLPSRQLFHYQLHLHELVHDRN